MKSLIHGAHLDDQIEVDSAGTGAAYHVGSPPDLRAKKTSEARGV